MPLTPFAITWGVGMACLLIVPVYPAAAGTLAVGLFIGVSLYAIGEEFGARATVLLTVGALCVLASLYFGYESHWRFIWPD